MERTATKTDRRGERGMTMIAVMAIMVITTVALLAAAPSIYLQIQREKEEEAIRRGEEIAEAIKQYIIHHNGTKLPESIDDLLEGLPQGTKKRMILRPSAAIDPLSEDGRWRLIKADPQTIARFAKRIQDYNNGLLPSNSTQLLDRYSVVIVNSLNTESDDDLTAPEDFDDSTDNTPFIGVASQSRSRSVLTYYGVENHSKWVFTPLFRGGGAFTPSVRPGFNPGGNPSGPQGPGSPSNRR
ncbi:MAG TPA: type II secretion system protein [Pyrinomonadaceae bacterium]|nr:type II secretion system protein [Pyrinomonadaceae bacterium]